MAADVLAAGEGLAAASIVHSLRGKSSGQSATSVDVSKSMPNIDAMGTEMAVDERERGIGVTDDWPADDGAGPSLFRASPRELQVT